MIAHVTTPESQSRVNHKTKPLYHHTNGLTYTSSGYGSRIPTVHMVQVRGKWRRVYAYCYSNNGTLYIGKIADGQFVNLIQEY